MQTIEQIHEEMAGYFRATGMSEAAAKRAAEGRNGPLRITSAARLTGDSPSPKKTPTPRLPSKHEISEDLAKRTSVLLIEEHGHRLSADLGGSLPSKELPTLEESQKAMAAHFVSLGMNEDAAKRAAQGRNR